jgi:hypothetical protein
MIWVPGPRYLQAMYPDHEKLAVPAPRRDWFAVICALAGLFQEDRPIAARGRQPGALAGACTLTTARGFRVLRFPVFAVRDRSEIVAAQHGLG